MTETAPVSQAKINGMAASNMYRMLRANQTFQLPALLSVFIAEQGWKAVEYIEPETETTQVAEFDCFTDWVIASPARGGLGSQVHVIADFVTQPMDTKAAPGCTVQLAKAEPALLPKLKKVAAANQQAGVDGWNAVVDQLDELAEGTTPMGRPKKVLDNVQDFSVKAPTGNSAAAGLRKLRRYAASEELCAMTGVKHQTVTEQYGLTIGGEKSVHRALIDCGLKKQKTTAAGLGIDGDPADVAQRIVKRLGKARAAQLVTALTALLTNDSN
jgi:hypothetical protein